MYPQIKPTETFRERQLMLLRETENRRLGRLLRARRTPNARSTAVAAAALGFLAALAVAVSFLLVLAAKPAQADGEFIFKVNSTTDFADRNVGDGVCDADFAVGNLCTLRAAIQESNATAELEIIHFNIPEAFRDPGSGVATIAPSSELPIITKPVVINGYSQPGASVNTATTGTNAQPKIVLSGADGVVGTSSGIDGLMISGGNTTIRGLVINGFKRAQNGEGGDGIVLLNNFVAPNTNNTIAGNFIGTDATGTTAVANQGTGIATAVNSTNNTIGGSVPADRNLISGNNLSGVVLGSNNRVQDNLIGTDKTGTNDLGNGSNGVGVSRSDNIVSGNTLAFNGGDGVGIFPPLGTDNKGNLLAGNTTFSNAEEGIDLNADGVTANDSLDTDTGPNDLQNFPLLTSAKTSRKATTIKGTLNSTPNKTFLVQFFSNASGNEGQKFIGQAGVSTDSSGNVSFSFKPTQKVPIGQKITATAIDTASKNTSEFSAAKKVVLRRR